MTKAILGVGALLAAALALAGCGGSGGSSGSASGTTGGVGAAHRAQGSGTFRARVHGFEAELQTSVHAFQSGNLSKAIASGGSLLTSCTKTVNNGIAPHASNPAQVEALTHLRLACRYMSRAASAGGSMHTAQAQQFARQALQEAQIAARMSG